MQLFACQALDCVLSLDVVNIHASYLILYVTGAFVAPVGLPRVTPEALHIKNAGEVSLQTAAAGKSYDVAYFYEAVSAESSSC